MNSLLIRGSGWVQQFARCYRSGVITAGCKLFGLEKDRVAYNNCQLV